jgi:predicted GTPase
MKDIPQFAVIGRVNKGKSSIVSALAEDDAVVIDSGAGTTIKCQEFPVMVDGRSIIILMDTPGFQQAPRALAWMKERETSAASRRDVVNDFYNTY